LVRQKKQHHLVISKLQNRAKRIFSWMHLKKSLLKVFILLH
jgi:hypothetical protein